MTKYTHKLYVLPLLYDVKIFQTTRKLNEALMNIQNPIWSTPADYLRSFRPEGAILFLDTAKLAEKVKAFETGFNGLTTYAVKANPDPKLIRKLAGLGVSGFDVASPQEIELVRTIAPSATLHYHNPVRSRAEIAFAVQSNVSSYSVDSFSELAKLADILRDPRTEIAVRLALPIKGARYDFGSKFGASPTVAAQLLARVAELGFEPTLTFHPGTQCTKASVWRAYIKTCAEIAFRAGIQPQKINVGGGFPSGRDGTEHDLFEIFDAIEAERIQAFPYKAPKLVCEPGRAMVSDAHSLAVMVKSVRDGADIFVSDGIYGTLSEQGQIGLTKRLETIAMSADASGDQTRSWRIFGPTCDSLDVLPDRVSLPANINEGDYLLLHSLGAYSQSMATSFNGYGQITTVEVQALTAGP